MKADARSLVFLDESGAHTNMTRLQGRAVRGQRVHTRVQLVWFDRRFES